jgi:predicted Rossmann fold nucleotide-binding protein DprA/Smf involved in DNA uptake
VRKPGDNETNANNLLITKGAIPVDLNGQIIKEYADPKELYKTPSSVNDPEISDKQLILDLLAKGNYSVKEIIHHLGLNFSEHQLRQNLKMYPEVEALPTKPVRYTHKEKGQKQISMFE